MTSFDIGSRFTRQYILSVDTQYVGGRVRVQQHYIAAQILTLTTLWSSPGHGYRATNFMWFVVNKQPLTSENWQAYPLCEFAGAKLGTSDVQL